MSGHSKWATIKHKKGAADIRRGKLFAKLIRQIEVAAKAGGSDLDSNATLRTAYNKARDNSVPNDTIDKAIKRGAGELDGINYESITYEGYAPNGVALLVDVLTDNRNRTGGDVRSIFSKNGGSLAEPGAVAWQFARTGVVMVDRSTDEDDLMLVALDNGADDIADDGDAWRVTCAPSGLNSLRSALDAAGFSVTSADSTMVATTSVALGDVTSAKQVLRLVDLLDDHDDVQDVYGNFDIPDDILEAAAG